MDTTNTPTNTPTPTQSQAEFVLNRAIANVAARYTAFLPIISSFRIHYTQNIPTLGVDPHARLAVNPDFLVENERYANGLLIHEILHIFFGHTSLLPSSPSSSHPINSHSSSSLSTSTSTSTSPRAVLVFRPDDPQYNRLVNMAEDCAINQFIKEALPEGCITPGSLQRILNAPTPPRRYEDAEYYLDFILKNLPKQQQPDQGQGQNPCSTDKACSQEMQDEMDKAGVPHLSQEELSDQRMNTAQQIAKQGKGRGNQYGQLADFAIALLKPKVDWQPLLHSALKRAEQKTFQQHQYSTYKRTSRRSQYPFFSPKKYGHKITVALSFDTSGSISHEQVSQFLAEATACMQHTNLTEVALWHTSLYYHDTPQNLQKDITNVFQTGGTYESCMGEVEEQIPADLYVHFSDGEHGTNYNTKHPSKHIEIIWDDDNIKEVRHL